MRILISSVLALSLVGCGGAAEPGEGDPQATATESPAGEGAAIPPGASTLDLEADGLVIPAQGGQEQLAVPFGTIRAAAETTLETVAGSQISQGENLECGAGPVQTTEYDGLVLNFQNDRLVGYFARPPYVPELNRAQMLVDPAVALFEGSTLGEEFTIGAGNAIISGLFDGDSDDATVEALWAGTNCLFR